MMFKWLQEYGESTSQTKFFTLNAIVYLLAIIITTVYCYARLDFVRSYRAPVVSESKQKQEISLHANTPAKILKSK